MTVSGDLVIMASELVELTQKWDEGSGSITTAMTKKHKSRERQINYLNDYKKLKSKSQVLFTKLYHKNFGGIAEIHGLCVTNNPWITSLHVLLTTLNFKEKT